MLLNTKSIRGIGIFRTIFYLPVVVPSVAAAILWIWLLNPQYGLVNEFLARFGIEGPKWFYDPDWSKNGIILMTVWARRRRRDHLSRCAPGRVEVRSTRPPRSTAPGAWAKLRHVTIPMISPAILFNLITGAIGAFQYFTQAYVDQ